MRVFARLLLCWLLACAAFACVSPGTASAAPAFVDQRVSAIPDGDLLLRSPRLLLDTRRQTVSRHLSAWTRPIFFARAFSLIVSLFYLWSSGHASDLRDFLRRRIRSPGILRFAFGFTLVLIVGMTLLPVEFLSYRVLSVYELTSQSVALWLQDQIVTLMLNAVIGGGIVAIILTLVERTRLWYLYAALTLLVFGVGLNVIAPVAIAPLYDKMQPLGASDSLAVRIHALELRAGLPNAPIYVDDRSRRSSVANAKVIGLGTTRRIVLDDTLLASSTPREVMFVVGHEMGHAVHGDVLRLTLLATLLTILAATIAMVIADRIPFRCDDDSLSRITLVGALLGAIGLLLYPVYTACVRDVEARADAFGLQVTGDRVAAVRAFVRFADEGLLPYCPPRTVRIYFYDHPPIGSRIAAMLDRPDPCP